MLSSSYLKHSWTLLTLTLITDLLGCTPLHIACYYGRLQIVKSILENAKIYGIDVDKKNNNGYNAEDIAKARERKEIVKLFVKSVN